MEFLDIIALYQTLYSMDDMDLVNFGYIIFLMVFISGYMTLSMY